MDGFRSKFLLWSDLLALRLQRHPKNQQEDVIELADCPPMFDEIVRPPDLPVSPDLPAEAPPNRETLSAHLLGSFHLTIENAPIEKLPNGRSGMLLKYLLYFHQRRLSRELLMETFWPDAEPEVARNRLNVAMSNIRHALRSATALEVVVFDDGKYFLHPDLALWVDVEELERNLESARQLEILGKMDAAVQRLEAAASLYQGDYLEDDPYEEWAIPIRERLRLAHLNTLFRLSTTYFDTRQYTACANMCQAILERDNIREDVHCLLMRCYARQNQFYLALRQYQVCVKALRVELNVAPAASTSALYMKLRQREMTQPNFRT